MDIPVRRRLRPAPEPENERPAEAAPPDVTEALGALALKVAYLSFDQIRQSARNARTHGKKQIHEIASSLRKFGFVSPLLVDEVCELIAGHGRLEAARQLGLTQVPTICLSHMSDAEKRAYRIADNRLAELTEWDEDILRIEFVELEAFDIDLPELTGFETAEIEIIHDGPPAKAPKTGPADEVPDVVGVSVSRRGDVWSLGSHRIICGDARDPRTYELLLGQEKARVVFTDPPFNVKVDGHVGGLGRVKHREFAMASGEMSRAEFVVFLKTVFERMAEDAVDGAILFTCIRLDPPS